MTTTSTTPRRALTAAVARRREHRPATPTLASRHRAAFVALALGGFTIGTCEFLAMGLLPEIAGGVGISVPTAGHVVAAYALGVFVGAPLLAGLGARVPRRRLLVALMAAYAAGNALSVLASDYWMLVGARFLAGLPHGAYFGVASLVAADLAQPGRRARAVARVLLGLSVANVVGVPLATWLGQAFGWRSARSRSSRWSRPRSSFARFPPFRRARVPASAGSSARSGVRRSGSRWASGRSGAAGCSPCTPTSARS